jgi:hypothetical protein
MLLGRPMQSEGSFPAMQFLYSDVADKGLRLAHSSAVDDLMPEPRTHIPHCRELNKIASRPYYHCD